MFGQKSRFLQFSRKVVIKKQNWCHIWILWLISFPKCIPWCTLHNLIESYSVPNSSILSTVSVPLNAGTFNECQLAWQAGDCWALSIKSLCIIIFSDNTVGEWFSKLSCLMHENSRNCHTYFVLDLVHIIYL